MFSPFVEIEVPSGAKIIFRKLKKSELMTLQSDPLLQAKEKETVEESVKRSNAFVRSIAKSAIVDGKEVEVTDEFLMDLYPEDEQAIQSALSEIISGKKA
jgi:hypothetical protein